MFYNNQNENIYSIKFSENNLTTKRSKPGISSENWNKILNKIAKFNFKKDQNIKI